MIQENNHSDDGYRDRYVAFLDILGFSQLTEKADQHPSWRAWLRDCIETVQQTLPQRVESTGFRFVQFSDSIVISAYRTTDGLLSTISGVQTLVQNMLFRQILLRGGIAAGNFHHDDHLMFGPALIRAYAFEQHGAPPHVALHEAVMEDLKPSLLNHNGFQHWLAQDPWDLSPMLNTLLPFQAYDGVRRPGTPDFDRDGFVLARLIDENARNMTHVPAVRAKWRWVQDYWNRYVGDRGILTYSQSYQSWDDQWQIACEAANARMAAHNVAQALTSRDN